jgi:hypothetical protein
MRVVISRRVEGELNHHFAEGVAKFGFVAFYPRPIR